MDATNEPLEDKAKANRKAEQRIIQGLMSAMSFAGFSRLYPPPEYEIDLTQGQLAFFVPDAGVVIWVRTPVIEYIAKGKILYSNIAVYFGVRGSGLSREQLGKIMAAVESATGRNLRPIGCSSVASPDDERFLHIFDHYELNFDQRVQMSIDQWAETMGQLCQVLRRLHHLDESASFPPLARRIGCFDVTGFSENSLGYWRLPSEMHESLASLLGAQGAVEMIFTVINGTLQGVWDYSDFQDNFDEYDADEWELEAHGSDIF